MKLIITLVTIFLSLLFYQVKASDNLSLNLTVRDSVQLNEVVVTGSRREVNKYNFPMSVSVIGTKQIENRFEPSLLPILTEAVPSLFITERGIMGYGVSTGSAGGMSILGVGGSPTTGVLVLIDGNPQYMGLMGHPLADSYQTMLAERVEVVRGPASVLYGSNAMGGVINIITKKGVQDGVKSNVRTMYGSYSTLSSEVNNAVKSGKFNSYIALGYNRTDGHRANMNFEQYNGYSKLSYDFAENWYTFADVNLTKYKASNPGTIQSPLIDNDADVMRGVTSFSIENRYEETSGAIRFYYNFGSHTINDGYSIGGTPQTKRFRSRDKMLGLSLYQIYSFFDGNQTTLGGDYQRFGGNAWNKFLDGSPDVSLVDETLNDAAAYANFQQAITEKVTLNAGLRFNHNDHFGSEWVPQGGVSFIASESTVLKTIVGKGFRNPTIRELYMFASKNPDLKPESLMNYELSASQNLLNNTLNIDLNLYYIQGNNSIQLIPVDGIFKYTNTGKIENYGLEFSSRYRVSTSLHATANYSWLHMKNKVVAAPEHKFYAGIDYTKNRWMIGTGIQSIHNLYTIVSPNIKKESFTLWNIRIAYKPTKMAEIFTKGENLLAQKYEINAGFPMPKATVFGGVNLRF